jgi:hypothetical protein
MLCTTTASPSRTNASSRSNSGRRVSLPEALSVRIEGFELVYDCWGDATELRAWLDSRDPAGPSSDIYAVRLDKDGTPGR